MFGEAVYSPETISRWDEEYEATMSQYAKGEIKPMSAAEYAARRGISLDD
jgi:hypothetical protein